VEIMLWQVETGRGPCGAQLQPERYASAVGGVEGFVGGDVGRD